MPRKFNLIQKAQQTRKCTELFDLINTESGRDLLKQFEVILRSAKHPNHEYVLPDIWVILAETIDNYYHKDINCYDPPITNNCHIYNECDSHDDCESCDQYRK